MLWRASGTFAGDSDYQGIRPTGGRVELRGLDLFTVRDGLIAANVAFPDGLGFARQIGMLPEPGTGAETAVLRAFNAKTRAARKLAGSPAEPVADGVWRVRGGVPRAMNVYLIEDEGGGVTVFDAGIKGMGPAIAAAASALGGINRIVLGHSHVDHRGAAPELRAPVFCHADDRAQAEGDGGLDYVDFDKLRPYARPFYRRIMPRVGRRAGDDRGHDRRGRRRERLPRRAHPRPLAGDDRAVPRARRADAQLGPRLHARRADGPLSAAARSRSTRSTSTPSRRARRCARWPRSRRRAMWPGHAEPLTGDVAAQLATDLSDGQAQPQARAGGDAGRAGRRPTPRPRVTC